MIDLSGRTDVPVDEEVLAELARTCGALGIEFFVIGAAARDLAIHALQQRAPLRATRDIDIAVAVRADAQFVELSERLMARRGSRHAFDVLEGEVDVVPFGGVETDRTVRFADDHLLDVNGFQEAHATSMMVRMPQGTEVHVATAAAQTALKILAWRDRHHGNAKDGLDLAVILEALSEAPFVDEV